MELCVGKTYSWRTSPGAKTAALLDRARCLLQGTLVMGRHSGACRLDGIQHCYVHVVNVVPNIGRTQVPGIVVHRLAAWGHRGARLRIAYGIHRGDHGCACVSRHLREPGEERTEGPYKRVPRPRA